MARELKPELMLALGEATALLHDGHPKLANAIVEAVNLLIEWRSAAPVPDKPDHATIRAAYDKWRGDAIPFVPSEHAAFGAGYYLGWKNG